MRVYMVWMPMLSSDNQDSAEKIARNLGSEHALHFYDPERHVGIGFVQDHFDAYMDQAFAALPKEHPLHERLRLLAAAPASEKPLWDALLFFEPSAEWDEGSPALDWWTRQVSFSGEGEQGGPASQFWRQQAKDGLLESDWFTEAREGLKTMNDRLSP